MLERYKIAAVQHCQNCKVNTFARFAQANRLLIHIAVCFNKYSIFGVDSSACRHANKESTKDLLQCITSNWMNYVMLNFESE